MKSFLQGVLLILGVIFSASAQRVCGSNQYKQQLLIADPSIKSAFSNVESQILSSYKKASSNFASRDTTPQEIINIPVVIHLLYKTAEENISDAQIKSQIDVLNADFHLLNADRANTPQAFKSLAGDARIQFCLAQVDAQGKSTTGIERKYTNQDFFTVDDAMKMPLKGGIASWDSKRYLNIWICKLSSSSVGYATPPGAAADMDGVVIAYDAFGTKGTLRPVFNKGRTATHEIGHWLGLIHVWGDDKCGDDHVDDTPTQESYNYGCQSFPKLSACSPNADGDMFMNFMDFSDDACMNLFTKGQVKRMRALFAQNGIRNSFLTSSACDSTLAQQGGALPVKTAPQPVVAPKSAKVYPSPAHSLVTIECKEASALTIKTLDIFNSLGMKVFTSQLIQEKTMLNISNLASGIYIVRIAGDHDTFTSKIIKQ